MESKLLCKPIMLHTKETGAFAYTKKYGIMYLNSPVDFQQHLYLISDREIKEGSWIYDVRDGYLGKHSGVSMHPDYEKANYRKVEATTDKSLGLPLIPQLFVEEYVQKQGKIDTVFIEVTKKHLPGIVDCGDLDLYDGDNFIYRVTILPAKDSWNREEVKSIAWKAFLEGIKKWKEITINIGMKGLSLPSEDFEEWFDKNY